MYLASEIGSLSGPELTKQANLAGCEALGSTCVYLPSIGIIHTWLLYIGCGDQTQIPGLAW